MELLGLITAIVIYASLFFMIGAYLIAAVKKKYEFSNTILLFTFIHSIIVNFIMLWAQMIMNRGALNLFMIPLDYTKLLIIFVPVFLLVEFIDIFVRKNIEKRKGINKLFRFSLSTIMVILFCLSTLLLYYVVNNYVYLITW